MRTETLLSASSSAPSSTHARAVVTATCPCGRPVRFTWTGRPPSFGVRQRYRHRCECGETHEHVFGSSAQPDAPVFDIEPRSTV